MPRLPDPRSARQRADDPGRPRGARAAGGRGQHLDRLRRLQDRSTTSSANVHLESHLKLTGEVRQAAARRGAARPTRPGSRSTRSCCSSPIRTRKRRCPTSCRRRTRRRSARGRTRRRATRWRGGGEIERGEGAGAERDGAGNPGADRPASSRRSSWTSISSRPTTSWCAATTSVRAAPTAAQVGSVNATVGADLQVTKSDRRPDHAARHGDTVRGFYEFQGRRFTLQRGGTVRFPGLPRDQSRRSTSPPSG